jgi:hypothetical protein
MAYTRRPGCGEAPSWRRRHFHRISSAADLRVGSLGHHRKALRAVPSRGRAS